MGVRSAWRIGRSVRIFSTIRTIAWTNYMSENSWFLCTERGQYVKTLIENRSGEPNAQFGGMIESFGGPQLFLRQSIRASNRRRAGFGKEKWERT